jgi:hypothetical protein
LEDSTFLDKPINLSIPFNAIFINQISNNFPWVIKQLDQIQQISKVINHHGQQFLLSYIPIFIQIVHIEA